MALNTVSSARLSTNVKASNLNSGFGQLGNRNLSINGADMMVAQRGTSTTGLQNTGGVYTIDRFAHRRGGTWANALWKDEQVNSGTGLFKKALKKTTTTAEGSAAGFLEKYAQNWTFLSYFSPNNHGGGLVVLLIALVKYLVKDQLLLILKI